MQGLSEGLHQYIVHSPASIASQLLKIEHEQNTWDSIKTEWIFAEAGACPLIYVISYLPGFCSN
jgi:hypothetical protein